MAHSTSMITAPVTMPSDIAAVLGIAGTDLAANCTSGNINMWAKYKPEGIATGQQSMAVNQLSLAQRQLNSFGIQVNYERGYGSLSGLVTALRNNSVNSMFNYIRPSGGASSPYRLTDFDGYYHGASAPVWSPYTPNTTLTVNGDGTLQLYYYANVNGSSQAVGLSDLRVVGQSVTFSNYYFGILIWNGSSYYAATQNHVMGSSWQEGLDVTLSGVPQGSYTYNMIPFFSTLPIANQSSTFYGTIYPMTFAISQINTGAASSLVSISTWVYVWSDDMGTIRLKWTVGNRTSGAFPFSISSSNSYVTVGFQQQQGTYGYWGINVSESIPANSIRDGDLVIASNLLYAQQDFIRNGDSYVQIRSGSANSPYNYTGIVQIWDR